MATLFTIFASILASTAPHPTPAPTPVVKRVHHRPHEAAYACNRGSKVWTHNEVRCAISRVWAHSRGKAGALRVAACESGFNATEVTGQFKGVYQIGAAYHPDAPKNLFDPVASAVWTKQITRDGRRWTAWQCGWAAR